MKGIEQSFLLYFFLCCTRWFEVLSLRVFFRQIALFGLLILRITIQMKSYGSQTGDVNWCFRTQALCACVPAFLYEQEESRSETEFPLKSLVQSRALAFLFPMGITDCIYNSINSWSDQTCRWFGASSRLKDEILVAVWNKRFSASPRTSSFHNKGNQLFSC